MPVSKPFFTVTQCCCPRGKSLFLRTNLQVLVLRPKVLVLEPRVPECNTAETVTETVSYNNLTLINSVLKYVVE